MRKSPANDPHLVFAVPGDLAMPTGGYRYDQRIIQELRELGWRVADISDCPEPRRRHSRKADIRAEIWTPAQWQPVTSYFFLCLSDSPRLPRLRNVRVPRAN